MIPLGSTVKDKITGFQGVVTGHVQYISGCNQVLVAPKCGLDGRFVDSSWFDEQRVVVVKKAVVVLDNSAANGFDSEAPKR